jgi:serine/threonine protein kinase
MADFRPLLPALHLPEPSAAGAGASRRLGRFELKSLLGQGAQAQVWLAFDPRLEREVAIKLMRSQSVADASHMQQWLQEARSVSRLNHPNIVQVFEADLQGSQAYLVFELVKGQTLAQQLQAQGPLTAKDAVALMLDVLGALQAAHKAGVVHRDLKPSNVLLDASHRARVMDFGIAARLHAGHGSVVAAQAAGTPAYMAPEAIRGEPVSPRMDLYAAGLMLAELLWGQPVRGGADVESTLDLAAREPLELPASLMQGMDDKLRAILQRATAFEPEQRYASAVDMASALKDWQAAQQPAPTEAAANANSTLEFLLRRMRHKSDFPAMSEAIVRIQSMVSSERESVSTITNEILKDVALTNKLLRLVNSAHYSRGAPIGTVSRAVMLVGFNGIRNMALSLVLLERMQDKHNAQALREEFLRALMAGSIAAELGTTGQEGEEAFIGALFQNLGRMLAQFYFPEEANTIRELATSPREPVSEEAASTKVLGLSFEALGLGVAKSWGLPEGIQRCIIKPTGDPPTSAQKDPINRQRWSARVANEMADAMLHTDPEALDDVLVQTAKRYARTLGMQVSQVQSATTTARKKLVELADAMEINVRPESKAQRLLSLHGGTLARHVEFDGTTHDSTLSATQLQATLLQTQPGEAPAPAATLMGGTVAPLNAPAAPERPVAQTLAAGIADISSAMVEDFKLADVLRMILEAMYRALDFHRIIFCMRDPKTDTLTGRFGLGPGIEGAVKHFQVPLATSATPDLFAAVCLKGADSLISDASDPRIVQRMPAWYRKSYDAPTFLVLPLLIKGRPFGMIYADKSEKGSLVVDERELSLLRTLRNQAVMAFKQAG